MDPAQFSIPMKTTTKIALAGFAQALAAGAA